MTAANSIVVGRLITEPNFYCNRSQKVATFKINNDKNEILSIIAHGKQASVCKSYLRQGNLCCVEGKFDVNKNAIIADRVTFLSKVYRQY